MSTQLTEKRQDQLPRAQRTYETTYVPRFDIWEGDDEVVLYGDLPGVTPESIEIRYEDNELSIHGRVAPRQEGVSLLHEEYGIGDFHRTFTVADVIDVDKIEAELRNGVLVVRLPKSESVKPRRIKVQAC